MNSIKTTLRLLIGISVSAFVTLNAVGSELTAPDNHHQVTCPDPAEAPCIMKRPFHSMDYTLLTKDVSISEGNGVWLVNLAKSPNKAHKKQTIRVMDFYGELHTIDVTLEAATKPETVAKSAKTNTKAAVTADKKNASMTDSNGKPISLEKYISK